MKRAIVTGGTKTDTAPMAVFAINIRNTNADLFDELVIFHDGISLKDQKLINSIFPTRFIKYKYPNKSKNNVVLSYFSEMLFCKYECFALLEDYDEVIWSDYDVVLLGRLDELCNVAPGHINVLTCNIPIRDMFTSNIANDEITQYCLDEDSVTTPLFTVSRGLNQYKDVVKWCYSKTDKWDKDLALPEQCVFSLAVQQFKIECDRFPSEKYAVHPKDAKGNEIILHAYGAQKFWNGLHNEKWDAMYLQWRNMGGTTYCEWKKKVLRNWRLFCTRIRRIK